MSARKLILLTLVYNVLEGGVAIWAAIASGSLALAAFGADSYLEVAAAGVVLWSLSSRSERIEEFAERFVGLTFLILAVAVSVQGLAVISRSEGADESVTGIALAFASLLIMPGIAIWKLKFAAACNEMVERARNLGPNPLRIKEEVKTP